MRSLFTTVLLLSCLLLITEQVDGQSASPDPVDLTSLSLAQLLEIQVVSPFMEEVLPSGAQLMDRPAPQQPSALRRQAWWRGEPQRRVSLSGPRYW